VQYEIFPLKDDYRYSLMNMDNEDDQDSSNLDPNENLWYDLSNLNIDLTVTFNMKRVVVLANKDIFRINWTLDIQMKKTTAIANVMKEDIAMDNLEEEICKIIRTEDVVMEDTAKGFSAGNLQGGY